MSIEEIKEEFKKSYLRSWTELIDEHHDELFFQTKNGSKFKISSDNLNSYQDYITRKSEYENKPFETCLCSSKHYEQMITSGNHFSPFLSTRHGEKIVFGDPDTDKVYVEISDASSDFKNYLRFHEYSIMRTLERMRMSHRHPRRANQDFLLLDDYLFTPVTIKVIGLKEANAESAAKKALDLIEGCLFNVAYLKGIALVLEEELPQRQAIGKDFQFEEHDFGKQLPIPKSKINRDIARFYQRGMVVEDPVNQYLSYYQVLEYFFLAVSDEELYRKLAGIINDPLFSNKPKHLDKVIQATLSHKRESDETEMLRLVLAKHLDESELIEFINAYEDHLADKRFTRKRKLFGEENEIRLTTGHVIGNTAKRVKLIRNALVHSSDRYNRQEKFIPTRAAESEIRKEVPLVKFLAEKVIITSFT